MGGARSRPARDLAGGGEGTHAIATPHIGEAIESLRGLVGLAENLVLPSAGFWEHEGAETG